MAWPYMSRQCQFVTPGPMLDLMLCHYSLEILHHFLNKGPHLFIFSLSPSIMQPGLFLGSPSLPWSSPQPSPTTCHLCECRLAPLWALHQDNAEIRLKYTFIRNSSFRKQEGLQWLLRALQVYTILISCKACKMKMGISNKIQKYVYSLCFPVVVDLGRQCSFFNRLLIKEENETGIVFR